MRRWEAEQSGMLGFATGKWNGKEVVLRMDAGAWQRKEPVLCIIYES